MLLSINKQLRVHCYIFIFLLYITPTLSYTHFSNFPLISWHILSEITCSIIQSTVPDAVTTFLNGWIQKSKKATSNNKKNTTRTIIAFGLANLYRIHSLHYNKNNHPLNKQTVKINNNIKNNNNQQETPKVTAKDSAVDQTSCHQTHKDAIGDSAINKNTNHGYDVPSKDKKQITAFDALSKMCSKFQIFSNDTVAKIIKKYNITEVNKLYTLARNDNSTPEFLAEPIHLLHGVLNNPEYFADKAKNVSDTSYRQCLHTLQHCWINALILFGANVTYVDTRYGSPLHHAAISGRYDICETLIIRGGALVNQRVTIDNISYTPLEYLLYKAPNLKEQSDAADKNAVCQMQFVSIAKLLIQNGAQPILSISSNQYNKKVWEIIESANGNQSKTTAFSEILNHMKGKKIDSDVRWNSLSEDEFTVIPRKNNSSEPCFQPQAEKYLQQVMQK